MSSTVAWQDDATPVGVPSAPCDMATPSAARDQATTSAACDQATTSAACDQATTSAACDQATTSSRRGRPRPPVTVLAAGSLAVLEAVGLLALGITSLDVLWGTGLRPPGALVVVSLALLASWIVLTAGSGAALVDGTGSRLLIGVAVGELTLLAVLGVGGAIDGELPPLTVGATSLPAPGVALLAAAIPLAKLLLGTTPTACAWTERASPVVAARRPAVQHRSARAVTLLGIGLALSTLALLGPTAPAHAPGPAGSSLTP